MIVTECHACGQLVAVMWPGTQPPLDEQHADLRYALRAHRCHHWWNRAWRRWTTREPKR